MGDLPPYGRVTLFSNLYNLFREYKQAPLTVTLANVNYCHDFFAFFSCVLSAPCPVDRPNPVSVIPIYCYFLFHCVA